VPERAPDFGPARVHPRGGAIAVGARKPLIAFNMNLRTDDLAVAIKIATAIRESSGGMPAVQAMGVLLENPGMPAMAQVSTNLVDWSAPASPRLSARSAASHASRDRHRPLRAHRSRPDRRAAGGRADTLGLKDFTPDQALELRLARDR
jgi:glutamate formiminotransferase